MQIAFKVQVTWELNRIYTVWGSEEKFLCLHSNAAPWACTMKFPISFGSLHLNCHRTYLKTCNFRHARIIKAILTLYDMSACSRIWRNGLNWDRNGKQSTAQCTSIVHPITYSSVFCIKLIFGLISTALQVNTWELLFYASSELA